MAAKVLIFSESFGLGHQRAASALISGLKKVDGSTKIIHTDSIRNSFPRLTNVFLKVYLQLINSAPRFWHTFYEKGRKQRQNASSKRLIYRMLSDSIKRVIKEFKPDVIVCTHPFPAAVVSHLKKQGLNIPLTGIITDYDIHGYWLDKNVDLYILGDRTLEVEFKSHNFKPGSVLATGIPIDPLFNEGIDKETARARIGLEKTRPVVLVAGGGWGLGDLGKIADEISNIPQNPQVVIVSGTNSKLKESLNKQFAGRANLLVKGLVKNIHEYMAAADIMVTKPGGLSTSEGLAAGLPMVLFDVIYGQECWNARFLTKNQAAFKTEAIEDIPGVVATLLNNPGEIERLSRNALRVGKPESSINAARKILELAG